MRIKNKSILYIVVMLRWDDHYDQTCDADVWRVCNKYTMPEYAISTLNDTVQNMDASLLPTQSLPERLTL